MATKKFICKVCGYVHEGTAAPEKCPVCQAAASEFEVVRENKGASGLFNKNGNLYIVLYSVVMVVIVAVLLSVTALALQPRQNANVLNEKKTAILQSLGQVDEKGQPVVEYDGYVEAFAVDANGNVIEGIDGNQAIDMLFDLKGAIENETYPVFKSADGKYVFPVTGQGLWDAIWGYVALEPDLNTVAGIALDHKGETPGLGAEIATAKHQALYKGKQIFDNGEFVSITLVKGGAKSTSPAFVHQVDAITGGTKTSDGVTAMLKSCLGNYLPYIESQLAAQAENDTELQESAEESNE